jgi:molecular chaperone GrpE
MVFARDALNLLDNLERSKQSINNDQNLDENSKKKIMDHIEIILNDTLTIFKKNNIVPVISINEKLDPNKHQAMMEIEDGSKEPGTIVQEIQKGFMLKDRLLRPSLVGVSKKPQKMGEKEPKK